MEMIAFVDGEKIGILRDGKITVCESQNIRKFREYSEQRQKNDEWKFKGEGARFRGDYDFYRDMRERVYASVNGLCFFEGKILYSYSVNDNSGVYLKDAFDEKVQESHIFTSAEEEILSLSRAGKKLAVTVQGNEASSSIGILDLDTNELKTLTSGDSLDKNPFLYRDHIYFDTAGLGRNANGEFTGKYAPAEICRLDLNSFEIEEVKSDKKFGYIKPKISPQGELFYIKRPAKEKKGNPFLEILLIPVRIFQALALFIQSFVISWTGKSLTTGSDNPARGREKKSGEIFVEGNLIEADKELRRSRRAKDRDGGFIPKSWKLVCLRNGKEEILKEGVCDYCFCEEGVCVTNGRHILLLSKGKQKKLLDTECCLCIASDVRYEREASIESDIFTL